MKYFDNQLKNIKNIYEQYPEIYIPIIDYFKTNKKMHFLMVIIIIINTKGY